MIDLLDIIVQQKDDDIAKIPRIFYLIWQSMVDLSFIRKRCREYRILPKYFV